MSVHWEMGVNKGRKCFVTKDLSVAIETAIKSFITHM